MTHEDIFSNFKRHFPLVATKVVGFRPDTSDSIVLYMEERERFIYDDTEKTIRELPHEGVDLDKRTFGREFGRRLQKMMDRHHMTQASLQASSNISQATISNYITGRSIPDFYSAYRLALSLGCSVDDLMYKED